MLSKLSVGKTNNFKGAKNTSLSYTISTHFEKDINYKDRSKNDNYHLQSTLVEFIIESERSCCHSIKQCFVLL